MKKTIIPNVSFYECTNMLRNIYIHFMLRTDELVEQFAPEGWQNSPYFQFLNKTIEEHYDDYRYLQENCLLIVESDQEIPGKPGDYYRKLLDKTNYSLDEFIDHQEWFVAEPRQEFMVIFACACSFITNLSKCDAYSSSRDLRNQMGDVMIAISSTYEEIDRDFSKEETYIKYAVQLFFKRYEENGYCLLPFLELFFEACKKAGWDWMYLNRRICTYPSLIESLDVLSKTDPEDHEKYEMICATVDYHKQKLGFTDDYIPSKEEMLDRELAFGVPETVTAFKNVYGYYPENYPPKFSRD
ncbi:hypothetical protein [Sphingobacterium chuzhouense]|uniref:Uncharacterized protein n=1 Tax=Sphingobacterium chuzhouense TaxID=1742264 RepID=A0ABR7XPX7_9SPHI|nr:hypothetical protein [Sphingobacterium chuzhouense]MBD1421228.1 hypothetical protein [Sphingobacterium chuzhouense]